MNTLESVVMMFFGLSGVVIAAAIFLGTAIRLAEFLRDQIDSRFGVFSSIRTPLLFVSGFSVFGVAAVLFICLLVLVGGYFSGELQ